MRLQLHCALAMRPSSCRAVPFLLACPVPLACCPPCLACLQAKQGFGLVEGHASVEDLIEEADGFAEVFPEHKHMIVKILQVGGRAGAWLGGWGCVLLLLWVWAPRAA